MFPSFVLFGREVYSYNLCVGFGAIATLLVLLRIGRARGLDRYVVEIALWAVVPALVGGVLLFGLTNMGYIASVLKNVAGYSDAATFFAALAPGFSGTVFYGGCFGALLGVWLWTQRHMPSRMGDVLDLYAVGLPLFHGFGRIGCFLGGCCFGIPCEVGLMFTHSPLEVANGVARFPVQLLEAALEFCLFFLVLKLYGCNRLRGRLLLVWTGSYACVRFLDEFLRGDTYRGFVGPLSISQWICLALLLPIVAAGIKKILVRLDVR